MTSRTHDNFRHNFWTWVDPPPPFEQCSKKLHFSLMSASLRSIVHLDCFSKYDFNLQSMVYKKKVLVIGYWVRSSNNHSPKLPFLHISFVQRHLFLLPRNILWFGWMLARKNFFGNKSKTSKSAKNIEIHKNSSRVTIWSLKSYARLMTLPKTQRTWGLSDLSKVTPLVLITSQTQILI